MMVAKDEWVDAKFIGKPHVGLITNNVYSICVTEDKDYDYNIKVVDSEENEYYTICSSENSFHRNWLILDIEEGI